MSHPQDPSKSAVSATPRTAVIRPDVGWLDIDFREILEYRGLIWLLVRRDFVSLYKQTVLGPAWFVFKPLLTTLTFVIVFGRVARLSTDGSPQFLFYFSGTIMWFYFSDSFLKISNVLVANANLFRKVYFPRLVFPLSILIANLIIWLLQVTMFAAILFFYSRLGIEIGANIFIVFVPVLVGMIAAFGLGLGLIVSAFTTKYRDLSFLLSFGVQLLMYATPVIYPMSTIPERYRPLFLLNPLSSVMEGLRYAFLGVGAFDWAQLSLSAAVSMAVLMAGLVFFSRAEKTFVDLV